MTDIINMWIELAKRGDREAFKSLLEEHYDMILRVAWRYTGSKADAEDVAQDVCMILPDRLGSFHGDCQFKSWLYRVVINRCKDKFKSQGARKNREQSYSDISLSLKAEEAELSEQLKWLYQQITALENKLRDTAMLVLAEGMKHHEAAEVLECEESTISWRMYEIRKILRTAWEQEYDL